MKLTNLTWISTLEFLKGLEIQVFFVVFFIFILIRGVFQYPYRSTVL